MVQAAHEMTITDAGEYQAATAFVKGLKALQKEIKATFDPVVEAAHRAHKEAAGARRKHMAPLEEAERLIKPKMGHYLRERETERIEQEKTLADAGDPVALPAEPKGEGISVAENWTFDITDIWALIKWELAQKAENPALPGPTYLKVDTVKLRKIIKALKADHRIPGVKAYAEDSVRVTSQ